MCKLIAIQIVNRYKVASFFDSIFHGETHLLIKRFAGILKIEFIFTHKQVACFFGDYAIFIQSIGYSRPFFVSGRIKQRKHNIAPIIAVVLKLVYEVMAFAAACNSVGRRYLHRIDFSDICAAIFRGKLDILRTLWHIIYRSCISCLRL